MLKNNYMKIGKKNDNDVDVDMAQLEHGNNKCYALSFRYLLQIDYINIDVQRLKYDNRSQKTKQNKISLWQINFF